MILSIFKDTDLTSIMVGNNAEKTKIKRPPDRKSSKLGKLSMKKNATKRRIKRIKILSFLRQWNVNVIKINKLSTPTFTNVDTVCPKKILNVAQNHERQRNNKRILLKFISNRRFQKMY